MKYEDRKHCWNILQSVYFVLQEREYALNDCDTEGNFVQNEASFMKQFGLTCLSLRNRMSFRVHHRTVPNKSILVLFTETPNPAIDTMRRCLRLGVEKQVSDLLIVVQRDLTFAAAELAKMQRMRVQIFTESELLLARKVLNHALVPKHVRLNDTQIAHIKRKFRLLDLNQLPRISCKDIICSYLGFEKGDVIRIHRNSEYIGEAIEYRIVF